MRTTLTFTNAAASSCVLTGYPSVTLLAPDGSAIGVAEDKSYDSGTPLPGVVKVPPGGTAYAVLDYVTRPCNTPEGDSTASTNSSSYVFQVAVASGKPVKIANPGFWLCTQRPVQSMSINWFTANPVDLD